MARLVVAAALLFASIASASAELRVSEAIRLYDGGEFGQAKDTLVTVVESPQLDAPQRTRARIYLAASYYALGDVASAKAQLLALAREAPGATIDPALFVPELVALHQDARREVQAERPAVTQVTPPVVTKPEVAPPAAVTRPRPSPALSLVPFGVGQFSNQQPVKGWTFLLGEVALFTASAVTLGLFEGLKVDGAFLRYGSFRPADISTAHTLQTVYLATFYVGLAVAAVGIGEAVLTRASDGSSQLTLRFGGTSVHGRF